MMRHYKNLLNINIKEEKNKNKGRSTLKSPREHQINAHNKMSNFFTEKKENKRGILVLPPGGGKTYTSIYWLLKNVISKNKKVLWLADQGFLLEQAFEEFRENILEVDAVRRNEINLRVVSGSSSHANSNSIKVSDDILFISSQTAISNWTETGFESKFNKFINTNSKNDELFIVYDEAHHTPAFGRRNLLIGGSQGKTGIIEKYPNIPLLGLTATPTYTNKNQRGWLWDVFNGGIVYEVSKKELEDKKILANPIFIQEKTNFSPVLSDSDIEKLVIRNREIPNRIIEEIAQNEDRNNFIADFYFNNREKFGKTIIFLDRWYQCMTVEKYLNKRAGKEIAASVFSYTDPNKNIEYINSRTSDDNKINLENFKSGKLEILINVKMLTEGIDVADVKTVFITRDTNSSILFTQMVGRALRGEKAGGGKNKSSANIVLFTDNWNKHIQFASNRYLGDQEDSTSKERGFRPFELISIELLENLQLEYEKQEYINSISDIIPEGWFVVNYNDIVFEDDAENNKEGIMESFYENVVVNREEKIYFDNFITEYDQHHKNITWEKEELDIEKANELINSFLKDKGINSNNSILLKLIQVARHLGQNACNPDYYTFEQKEEVSLTKHVLKVRSSNFNRDKTEEYLEAIYYSEDNPFVKVIFQTFDDFYKAYEYEDNIFRKKRKVNHVISIPNQALKTNRLVTEEIRKRVFSRDGNKCLCCGKKSSLQIDHIISFKEEEPNNDDPNLFQTLCGTCNKEKSSNAFNYRNCVYDKNKEKVEDVLQTESEKKEGNTGYYFSRLINCYYKTSAVHLDNVNAKNHGQSIWKASIKYGVKPEDSIMKNKVELLNVIRKRGFKLKDIMIEVK